MESENLSPEERKAFNALTREANLPDSLENEIIQDLKMKGLITKPERKKAAWILYPVAASLIFILGFLAGNLETNLDKNKAYMLVLFEDENFQIENPEDVAMEYGSWNSEVNTSGYTMDGQELWNETIQINRDGVERLGAGHQSRITGYFVLEAGSEEEALSIASQSPHIKYGGTIQLKRFRTR